MIRLTTLLISIFLVSCGYDDSIGRLADDIEKANEVSEEISSENDEESEELATEDNEVAPQAIETTRDISTQRISLVEDDLNLDNCTDWSIEGDFQVSIETKNNSKLIAYFDASACNSAEINYNDEIVFGGICSNNQDFTLFHEKKLRNPTHMMIERKADQLSYKALSGDEWITLAYISLKENWQDSVEFCVQ